MKARAGTGNGGGADVTVQGVRRRADLDADAQAALADIHARSFPPEEQQYSMAWILDHAGRHDCLLRVARVAGSVVGYAYLELGAVVRAAWLWYIATAPTVRNRGIGASIVADVLATLRRDHPDLRLMLFEVGSPLEDEDEARRALDRRRIGFYRRLGASWVRGVDYRIPAADDPGRSLAYDPMFFALGERVSESEIRRAVIEMGRQSYLGNPDDERWLNLVASVSRMWIVPPDTDQ